MRTLYGKIKIIVLLTLYIVLLAGCEKRGEEEKKTVSETEEIDIGYERDWANIISPDMEEYNISCKFVNVSFPQFQSFDGYPVEINPVLEKDVIYHCNEIYGISCAFKLEGKVTYLDEQYISVLYQGIAYPDTAAWDFAWGITIDIKTGEIASIEDVAEFSMVLDKLEQKKFELVRGISLEQYEEMRGKEYNWKEEYDNLSMGSYDENHCYDFYLKKDKIGILLGVEQAGYSIVELDR